MKRKRELFWYLSLLLVVVATGVVYSVDQKKTKTQENQPPQKTKIIAEQKSQTLSINTAEKILIEASITAKKSTEVSSGVFITQIGDDLLVLINKTIRLPASYTPNDLVLIDGFMETKKAGMMLRSEAAKALEELNYAAKADGASIVILSAYRSYWSQQATFSSWVGSAGLASAETFSARPGHSQHQLGTTLDYTSESVNLGLSKDLTKTAEGKWMAQNAHKYGFVISYPKGAEAITGYIYEPWHYRYIGIENAQNLINSGLILEVYLKKFGSV